MGIFRRSHKESGSLKSAPATRARADSRQLRADSRQVGADSHQVPSRAREPQGGEPERVQLRGVPATAEDRALGDVGARPFDHRQEKRLVEAASRGDVQAVETLYRSYYDSIYRYVLLRLGSITAAEDVTSQVFLGMIQGLGRFRDEGKPFLAWLYAIAQRQVALHLRQENRAYDSVDIDALAELAADTAGPHATIEERETRALLAQALRDLPEAQREVILLRYILGLSVAETAAAIGRSEGAVKQLQLRGLSGLKSLLESWQ